MKKRIFGIIIFLFCCCFILTSCGDTVPKNEQLTEEKILKRFEMGLVKIYGTSVSGKQISQGTGFYCNYSGDVITNAHVVNESAQISFTDYKHNTIAIKGIYAMDYNKSDYCVMESESIVSLGPTYSRFYKKGDIVYSLGFPNDSNEIKINKGKIIGDIVIDNRAYIENTAYTDNGSSGGVLVNAAGEIIGITSIGLDNGNYGSIPCDDFYHKILNDGPSKSIAESFFNVSKIPLNEYNIGNYFDIFYVVDSTGYKSKTYEICIALKSIYKNKVIVEDIVTGVAIDAYYEEKINNGQIKTNYAHGFVVFQIKTNSDVIQKKIEQVDFNTYNDYRIVDEILKFDYTTGTIYIIR